MPSCPRTCRARSAIPSTSNRRPAAADPFRLIEWRGLKMKANKSSLAAAVAAAGLLLPLAAGQAHHGVQVQFDVSQVVEKHGVLRKIDWINPHIYMHFEVLEDGVVKHYAIESLGILGLRR